MSRLVEIDWNPPQRVLRQFGWLALCALGGLSVAAWHGRLLFAGLHSGRHALSLLLLALGAVSALFSLLAPRCNRPLFLALTLVSYPVGFVASYVILGFVFFCILAPLGLLFRLSGRDALQRSQSKGATSYWSVRPPSRKASDYFRQF